MIENIINDIEDDDQQLFEHWKVQVDEGQTPVRIDKYLAEKNPYQSRNRIQNAADAGFIQVNGTPVKSNYKVRPNDVITLMLDYPKHDTSIVAENIPIDVVYEDDDLMVKTKMKIKVQQGNSNHKKKDSRFEHTVTELSN